MLEFYAAIRLSGRSAHPAVIPNRHSSLSWSEGLQLGGRRLGKASPWRSSLNELSGEVTFTPGENKKGGAKKMERSVVSISRTLGAGGEEIGRLCSKELGYAYTDDDVIVHAAERAGVSPETIGQVEHSQSLLARILDSAGSGPVLGPVYHSADPAFWSNAPALYQDLIERVIRETARNGRVVIVAHGASIPLAGMPGLLRVLITASPKVRGERIRGADLDEQKAQETIEASDKERARFFRRFYNLEQELPTQYDLVVNTDDFSVDEAAKLIVSAAKG